MVMPSVPVANLVPSTFRECLTQAYSHGITLKLQKYSRSFAASAGDPDVIFGSVVEYVLGEHRLEPKFFWAAVGIVTYYFELCDIFER